MELWQTRCRSHLQQRKVQPKQSRATGDERRSGDQRGRWTGGKERLTMPPRKITVRSKNAGEALGERKAGCNGQGEVGGGGGALGQSSPGSALVSPSLRNK